HTLVKANEKKKGKFEKFYLEGRPPVNVGLTSGGDFLGGTAVSFTDVLADQPVRHVDLAVPLVLGLVREPRAALPVRPPGLLADAVLLRPARRHLLRP